MGGSRLGIAVLIIIYSGGVGGSISYIIGISGSYISITLTECDACNEQTKHGCEYWFHELGI